MPGKTPDSPSTSRGGIPLPREIQSIHVNGSASLAELREFLGGLHGKSPQEVIGIVSASLLIQSMVVATLATAVILAIFTVGPYLVYGPPQEKQAKKPAAAAPADAPATDTASPPASGATATAGQPDPEKAAKALGIDETKGADPTKNPLDNPNFDKLLDKLE
jgi:hypothetical protein